MKEYLNVLRHHYADFRGRARRREYWMFALVNGVISLLLQLPFQIQNANAAVNATEYVPTGLGLWSALLAGLYSLAVLLPSLAVAVRRLHDTGRSGWWLLVALVPFIGGLVLLIFMLLDGEPDSNRWGPNPKGVGSAAGDAAW